MISEILSFSSWYSNHQELNKCSISYLNEWRSCFEIRHCCISLLGFHKSLLIGLLVPSNLPYELQKELFFPSPKSDLVTLPF